MRTAITRAVSPTLESCELTCMKREPIDMAKAVEQHEAYEQALRDLGLRVISMPALAEFPDAMFVEDALVVTDELAVLTRPGAASRRGESESLVPVIGAYRPVRAIEGPATLDGGDVMRIGRDIFVGLSTRTNQAGIAQLADLLGKFGDRVRAVEVRGCLHLKSACCSVGDGAILINRNWVHCSAFEDYRLIDVSPDEPGAANVLRVGDTLLMPDAFPRTREILNRAGFRVLTIDISELMKAEAGVTCSSVIFEGGTGVPAGPS